MDASRTEMFSIEEIESPHDISKLHPTQTANSLRFLCKWSVSVTRDNYSNFIIGQSNSFTVNNIVTYRLRLQSPVFSPAVKMQYYASEKVEIWGQRKAFELKIDFETKNVTNSSIYRAYIYQQGKKINFHKCKLFEHKSTRYMLLDNREQPSDMNYNVFKNAYMPDTNSIVIIAHISVAVKESLPNMISILDSPESPEEAKPRKIRKIEEPFRKSTESQTELESNHYVPTIEGGKFWKPSEELRMLYETKEQSDLIIKVQDKDLQAHKLILGMESTELKKMFASNQVSKIEVDDIDYETMKIILKYIYTSELNIDNYAQACDVLKAAHKYKLQSLKNKIEIIISRIITTATAMETLVLAELYDTNFLKDSAINIIAKNLKSFKTSDYAELKNKNSALLFDIIAKHIEN